MVGFFPFLTNSVCFSWYRKHHPVIEGERICVLPERRKISALPYIESYLNGSNEDVLEEQYITATERDFQFLQQFGIYLTIFLALIAEVLLKLRPFSFR